MKKLFFLICAYFFLVSFCDKPEIILRGTWAYAGGQYTFGNYIVLDADNLKSSNYKIVISYDVDIKNKDGDETIYLTVSVPDIIDVDTTNVPGGNFRFIFKSDGITSLTKYPNSKIKQIEIGARIISPESGNVLFPLINYILNNRKSAKEKTNVEGYSFVIDDKKQRKGSAVVILNIPKDSKYSNMAFRITATVECRPNNYICPNDPVVETITHVIQMPYNNINATQKE
jgi:hypothetical protein